MKCLLSKINDFLHNFIYPLDISTNSSFKSQHTRKSREDQNFLISPANSVGRRSPLEESLIRKERRRREKNHGTANCDGEEIFNADMFILPFSMSGTFNIKIYDILSLFRREKSHLRGDIKRK